MADLGKAYVQIVPSAEGISGSISSVLNGEAQSAGTSAGANIAGKLITALKGALAAAGIGKLISDTINAGADLEQSIGGIETLFGAGGQSVEEYAQQVGKSVGEVKDKYGELMKAQDTAFANANQAYKTAGLSANDYMQTITGFAASLKQSTKDEQEAAEVGNQAVIDMSDNANKMGTSMQSIQQAYQGFAKQNYTMLDNLKLGYGGTKTEMERLLKDAQKISGQKYDINNLKDVYNAIHVIQGELGITGTTAKEAASTYSGSLNMLKSSWANVMASLGNGEGISEAMEGLGESLGAYGQNLFRILGNIFSQIPGMISSFASTVVPQIIPAIANIITSIQQQLPTMLQNFATTISQLIPQIISGIQTALPQIQAGAQDLINQFCTFVTNDLPTVMQEGVGMVNSLVTGILNNLPTILQAAAQLIGELFEGIMTALPTILDAGLQIVANLAVGILNNLPQIITTAGQLIISFVQSIAQHLPEILEKGAEFIRQLVQGIKDNLPEIISAAAQIVAQLAATILENLPEILQVGIELILELVAGLIQAIPDIIRAMPQIISSITDAFSQYDWKSLGSDILEGIKNGITGAVSKVVEAAKNAGQAIFDAVKGFFKIGSPSKVFRDEIGKMIDEGWAIGITKNTGDVTDATEKAGEKVKKTAKDQSEKTKKELIAVFDFGQEASTAIASSYQAVYSGMSDTDALKAAQKDVVNFALTLYETSDAASDVADSSEKTSDRVKKTLEGAKKAYEDLEGSVKSNIEKQISYFDKYDSRTSEQKEKDKVKMSDVLSNMVSQITGVQSYVQSFTELAGKGVSQPLLQYLQSLGKDGASYIEAFRTATAEQIQQANQLFAVEMALPEASKNQIMQSYVMAASGAAGSFNTEMINQTAAMVTTATQSAQSVSTAMDTAFSSETSAESAVAAGKTATESVSAGVQSGQDATNTQVRTFSNMLTSTMAAELSGDKTFSIGRDLVAGIAQGISANTGIAADAVRSLCSEILSTAQSSMKIGSPSRVMADEVGRWIPAGIAVGIVANFAYVASAIRSMGQGIVSEAQGIGAAIPQSVGSIGTIGGAGIQNLQAGGYTQNVNIYSPTELSPSEVARQTRNSTRDMVLALRGV